MRRTYDVRKNACLSGQRSRRLAACQALANLPVGVAIQLLYVAGLLLIRSGHGCTAGACYNAASAASPQRRVGGSRKASAAKAVTSSCLEAAARAEGAVSQSSASGPQLSLLAYAGGSDRANVHVPQGHHFRSGSGHARPAAIRRVTHADRCRTRESAASDGDAWKESPRLFPRSANAKQCR